MWRKKMRKLLSIAFCLAFSLNLLAKKDVTKFLGIPVDGTKTAMIQKLRNKGFTYNAQNDRLQGEFNGRKSYIFVVTNNNKVWRIMVGDAQSSNETDIRIRFNNLCEQFENNEKYISPKSDQKIPEDEDISYKMLVDNKRYEASFLQRATSQDSTVYAAELRAYLLKKYTEKQLNEPTDDEKRDITMSTMDFAYEEMSKRSVWFMIDEQYGEFRILLYYDNEYNHSNGEDL